MERASDNQQLLSNLLNITDGFLGDLLKLHVICRINAPIENVHPAILRSGRLTAWREFARLSDEGATILANA